MFLGLVFALAAGISLGSITSFAALSYDHGVEPLSLIALRGMVAAVIMLAVCRINKEKLSFEPGGWRYAVLIGISLSMVGFGYMGSVAFISPGLAVAILFLFPITVLAIDSIRQRSIPPIMAIIGFGLALVGIVICVGIGGPLHPTGITLALIASFGMGFFLLSTGASSRAGYGSSNIIWANMMIVALAFAALIFTYEPNKAFIALPNSTIGIMAILAAAILYALGILFSSFALRLTSAPLVALFLNVEPIVTLIAARFIVNEELSLLQYSGMIIAVIGIMIGSVSLNKTERDA